MEWTAILGISVLLFLVAALYSSVGHGGASGYLAILSLFAVSPAQMSGTALILNVFVAGMASITFFRAGHLNKSVLWPFVAVSVPAAFLGGYLRLTDRSYLILLAIGLILAAARLGLPLPNRDDQPLKRLPAAIGFPIGGMIGMFSGMIGIGGGILLSPILILSRWSTAKQAAAVAAVFITANSLAGIGGRLARGGVDVLPLAPPLIAAFLGGLLGSHWGANRFSNTILRRLLAIVLVLAAVKLWFASR